MLSPQFLLGPLALGDVPRCAADEQACLVLDREIDRPDLDGELAAVLAPRPYRSRPAPTGLGRGDDSSRDSSAAVPEAFGTRISRRLADQLLAAVAEGLLGLGCQLTMVAVGV